jgi:hypothetical protein
MSDGIMFSRPKRAMNAKDPTAMLRNVGIGFAANLSLCRK